MSQVRDGELVLAFALGSVSEARHWAAARCVELTGDVGPNAGASSGDDVLTDLQRQVELVTTELVANAVEHGSPPLRIVLERRGDVLQLRVADGNPVEPVHRNSRPDATSGRGIALVDHLSERWGVERTGDGKVVWCELRVRPTAA